MPARSNVSNTPAKIRPGPPPGPSGSAAEAVGSTFSKVKASMNSALEIKGQKSRQPRAKLAQVFPE
jgi:hypothetical protein